METPGPPLPLGWECRYDTTQSRLYYLDHGSRITSWLDPRTPVAAALHKARGVAASLAADVQKLAVTRTPNRAGATLTVAEEKEKRRIDEMVTRQMVSLDEITIDSGTELGSIVRAERKQVIAQLEKVGATLKAVT